MAISSYRSADEHSRGAVFSGQDLALVKDGRWLPELSHFVPINSPHDIDVNLDHARDDGEKIDLLLTTALNPHTDTLRCLGEFIQSRDLTILAATLRAFASIGEMLKVSSLDPEYRHHLEHLRWVLTENLDLTDEDNPSVQLFKRLCQEAESGSSDLIRWAAAYALQQLNYPAGLRRQLLSKPPAEIATDIVPKYGGKLSGRENPLADRDHLKFWVYGATEGLFSGGNGTYYLEAVREVLSKLGMRGIRLALQCGNKTSLVEAINFAGGIFGNSLYKDEATRRSLVERLLPFLNRNDDLEVRNLVAEKLNDKNHQYQVSDRLLKQSDQIRVAVMDADWRRVITLGEAAVPLLCGVVEGSLKLRDGASNVDFQIKALETIDKIITETNRKITTLSPYLNGHVENYRIIVKAAELLQPWKKHLNTESNNILIALLFELKSQNISNVSSLSQFDAEERLKSMSAYKQSIEDIFTKAQDSTKKRFLSSFLDEKERFFLFKIYIYSGYLKERIIDLAIKELTTKEAILYKEIKNLSELIEKIDKGIRFFLEHNSTSVIILHAIFVVPIILVIYGLMLSFFGWLLLVLTGVLSWDQVVGSLTVLFYLIWIIYIAFLIGSSIRSMYANSKKKMLQSDRGNIKSEVDRLKKDKAQIVSNRSKAENDLRNIEDSLREVLGNKPHNDLQSIDTPTVTIDLEEWN